MHLERKLFLTSAILFLLIIGASFVVGKDGDVSSRMSKNISTLTLGTSSVRVEVVDDEVSRSQGLSGRLNLDKGTGMLFIFDRSDLWGIWMKDMRISIDVIWLDQTGKIVTVEENMSPDTYPKIFFPTKRARYVLEVPAGAFRASGASIGDMIDLSSLASTTPSR